MFIFYVFIGIFSFYAIYDILLKTVKNNIVACLCNAFYTNLSLWNTTRHHLTCVVLLHSTPGLTLLSMCGTKIKSTCSRPAGSKSLWSTWTFACEQHKVNSPDSYIPCSYFTLSNIDFPLQVIYGLRNVYNVINEV
jgi:hypothetical protein